MVVGQLSWGCRPSLPERGARGEALPAVAVRGAGAGERITIIVVRDPHVPGLGMDQPVHGAAVEHQAGPDPGANRQVAQTREARLRSPTMLANGGRVHVGVEGD